MPLVKTNFPWLDYVTLKPGDFALAALTSCGVGSAEKIGALELDMYLWARLAILSSSTGGIKVWIQGNSSSGEAAATWADRIAFSSQASRGIEGSVWPETPAATGPASTDKPFWRVAWSLTTCGESYRVLCWMSLSTQ